MNEKNNKVIKADEKKSPAQWNLSIIWNCGGHAGERASTKVKNLRRAEKMFAKKQQFLFIPLTYERKTQIQMTFRHIFLSVARLFFAFIAGDAREY